MVIQSLELLISWRSFGYRALVMSCPLLLESLISLSTHLTLLLSQASHRIWLLLQFPIGHHQLFCSLLGHLVSLLPHLRLGSCVELPSPLTQMPSLLPVFCIALVWLFQALTLSWLVVNRVKPHLSCSRLTYINLSLVLLRPFDLRLNLKTLLNVKRPSL